MPSFPLSLYIDLEQDQKADLEVAARAAIAWSKSIKESAYIFDPSAEVEVKFISGTESSLSLNSAITFITKSDVKTYVKTTVAAALVSATWHIVGVTTDYMTEAALEAMEAEQLVYYVADKAGIDISDEIKNMSQEEVNALAERIASELKNESRREQSKQIIRELQKDPAVRGVGITPKPDRKPSFILNRDKFSEATSSVTEEGGESSRNVHVEQRLKLVAPRIVEDNKVWRFQGPEGEIGFYVEDTEFKHRFTHGQLDLDFEKEVVVTALVRYEQKLQNGIWVNKKRYIEKVLGCENEAQQADLFSDEDNDSPDSDQDS